MRRSKSFAARDQSPSGFAAPLGRLCDALPADAAAVVDAEGETVDYSGFVDPFTIKVAAAEIQLVLSQLSTFGFEPWSQAYEVVVRARGASFFGMRLTDGYSIIVKLPYRAFSFSRRALCEVVHEVCAEAGLSLPVWVKNERWMRVDVEDDGKDGRRPKQVWLDQGWSPLLVMGRYHGPELGEREVAYRVRLADGQEATFVRERLGRWYSDHPLLLTTRGDDA